MAHVKKMIVYQKTDNPKKPRFLRSVLIDHTFIGIGKRGEINKAAFNDLAQHLESKMDFAVVLDI